MISSYNKRASTKYNISFINSLIILFGLLVEKRSVSHFIELAAALEFYQPKSAYPG